MGRTNFCKKYREVNVKLNEEGEFVHPVFVDDKPKGIPLKPLWARTARARRILVRAVIGVIVVIALGILSDKIFGITEYNNYVQAFYEEYQSGLFPELTNATRIDIGTIAYPNQWKDAARVPDIAGDLSISGRWISLLPTEFSIGAHSCQTFNLGSEASGLYAVTQVDPSKVVIILDPGRNGAFDICTTAKVQIGIVLWAYVPEE